MARRLPPHVQSALAKRRGTARQRQLSFDMQAPLALDPAKLQKARDLVRDRHEQKISSRAKQRTPED
jgi:hypothetical protein